MEIAWPSDEVPLTIACRSLPSSEKVTVCSFGGIPVLYLVLAEFSFHVPTKRSAAINAPANARSTNTTLLYRMEVSFGAVSYHTRFHNAIAWSFVAWSFIAWSFAW